MKKYAAILLLLIQFIQLSAQREYLPTADDLNHFYKTKTYVVLSDNPLSEYNFEIQDAINKYWDITEYEFIPHDNFGEKSVDKNASFLYVAAVNFEKDKSQTRYMFLCLSLGGDYESINDMKDITNIPLSYHGVDEDRYTYKLGIMIRFMQNHVRLLTENPDMVSQNVFKHYNDNMADMRGKTLYLVEEDLERSIASEAKLRKIYPYDVKIVTCPVMKKPFFCTRWVPRERKWMPVFIRYSLERQKPNFTISITTRSPAKSLMRSWRRILRSWPEPCNRSHPCYDRQTLHSQRHERF
jgi:hypothetical protein